MNMLNCVLRCDGRQLTMRLHCQWWLYGGVAIVATMTSTALYCFVLMTIDCLLNWNNRFVRRWINHFAASLNYCSRRPDIFASINCRYYCSMVEGRRIVAVVLIVGCSYCLVWTPFRSHRRPIHNVSIADISPANCVSFCDLCSPNCRCSTDADRIHSVWSPS